MVGSFFYLGGLSINHCACWILARTSVEPPQLRTKKSLRNIPKAVSFLDSLIYNVQNAFQAFASAKGLDVVVDLISDEVKPGSEEAGTGKGIPDEYKSSTTDFKIGFYRQQTFKMLFKLVYAAYDGLI